MSELKSKAAELGDAIQGWMQKLPHRRFNPLLDEWMIVVPDRWHRPWHGQDDNGEQQQHNDNNPLKPGGARKNGIVTPDYETTYVFTNDFPSLRPKDDSDNNQQQQCETNDPLFSDQRIYGTCRVMCYSPKSEVTLTTMSCDEIVMVIKEWQAQLNDLGSTYDWVSIFENKGTMVGCSNPHPHCQIWATDFLPNHISTKHRTQTDWLAKHGTPMLLQYAQQEVNKQQRLIALNDDWVVLVPYWACWPFETMLLPRQRHILRLTDLTEAEVLSLAVCMRQLLVRYDNLFKCSFPFMMGWNGAPTGRYLKQDCSHWQLHATYLPPLLRSSTVQKFMAGFEMLCEPQRDLSPELAAKLLRDVSGDTHYTEQKE